MAIFAAAPCLQCAVDILVAIGAPAGFGMILGLFSMRSARDMARRTSHRRMRSIQGESGSIVRRNRISGRIPAGNFVALLASFVLRLRRELALMRILVAIGAGGEGHAVLGGFAFRFVTLG